MAFTKKINRNIMRNLYTHTGHKLYIEATYISTLFHSKYCGELLEVYLYE